MSVVFFLAGMVLPLMFWVCRWLGWPFWYCGVVLLLIAGLYLVRRKGGGGLVEGRARWVPVVVVGTLGLVALLAKDGLPLQLYPVFVSLMFLCVFAVSLMGKQTVIERLARRLEPDLPPSAVRYMRRVTQAWCVFFVLNAAIACWSIAAGDRVWAIYNGLVAYILMVGMFVGEWLIRRCVRRRGYRSSHD